MSTRELEYSYLAASQSLTKLLEKKAAAYATVEKWKARHQELLALGQEIASMENARELECQYLAGLYQIQELLQEKTATYALSTEFDKLHLELSHLGTALGWPEGIPQSDTPQPEVSGKIHKIQKQIEDLRTAIA